MRYTEICRSRLTEDESQDSDDREEALNAYLAVKSYLLDNETKNGDDIFGMPNEHVVKPYGQDFMLSLIAAGVEDNAGLVIVFTSKKSGHSPAFGFFEGTKNPLILMPILNGSHDPFGLASLFSHYRVKTEFLHEYAHFLLWRRTKFDTDTSFKANGGEQGYYNHPHELDAYYKEAVASIVDQMRNLAAGTTETELRKRVWNQINRKFRNSLTPENRQRLLKRIARFVRETLMPMLGDLLAKHPVTSPEDKAWLAQFTKRRTV